MCKLIQVCLVGVCLAMSAVAHAQELDVTDTRQTGLVYVLEGAITGGLVGLSTGYLLERKDGFDHNERVSLGYRTGWFAAGGAGVGLLLGIIDLDDHTPGRASLILRDTLYGAGAGLFFGAIAGTMAATETGDLEHITFGMAIGTVACTGLGFLIGLAQDPEGDTQTQLTRARHIQPSFGAAKAVGGQLVFTGGASGRF